MNDYGGNYVSGFFKYKEQAEAVLSRLIASGFSQNSLHFIDKYAVLPTHAASDERASTLSEIVLSDDKILDAILAGKIVVIAETQKLNEVTVAEQIIKSVSGDHSNVTLLFSVVDVM